MSRIEAPGKIIKRELIRALLERTQSMDTEKMMSSFGAAEPVVYDDVEEQLNVAYVNRDEVALAMDIFSPKVPEGTELPVIVLIHGGGLFMGDRGLDRPYSRFLAHRGYLVFSLEYRLAPRANICQQLDDVCAGMDMVGSMLVDYDVDFGRIFLVADSAGAYLAEYVTAMHGSEKLQDAIGYEPSRMVYAAVGFLSGMFYPSKVLLDQVFGKKRDDDNFRKFMSSEHPELLKNLPPAFLVTSCGDTFNNYSIRFHKALKKAGRPSKLLYIGDEELRHIFMISDPEHPKSVEATDRMLEWFEDQAVRRRESRAKDPETEKIRADIDKRIADGSINDQKAWSRIKEGIAFDNALLNRIAIVGCTREYTYGQMFAEWERYAGAFSGLGICSGNSSRAVLCGAVTPETLFALYGLNMAGAEVSLYSYADFLPGGSWMEYAEDEGITDLVITDILLTPEMYAEITDAKERLGLRNIVLLHSLLGGPAAGPAELIYNEYNYHMLRRRSDTVFMEELLDKYGDGSVISEMPSGDGKAFIVRASGDGGERGAIALTDRDLNGRLNEAPDGQSSLPERRSDGKADRVIVDSDLSSLYSLCRNVHYPLSMGDTVVMTYFGYIHPKFIRAVDYYNISRLSVSIPMADSWLRRSDIDDVDLSSLRMVELYGEEMTSAKMEEYREFFRLHGYKYDISTMLSSEGPVMQASDLALLKAVESSGTGRSLVSDKEKAAKSPKLPEIPEDMKKLILKYGNRLSGLSSGRRWIDHDFED